MYKILQVQTTVQREACRSAMNTLDDFEIKRDSIVIIHDQLVAHFSQRISSAV